MEPVIECAGLSKRFGRLRAVDNLDLTISKGEVFGFLGPNGAGKSTTIRMLLSLIRPNSGRVSLFGMDPDRNRRAVFGRVGALVESAVFYEHLSGRRNLELLASLSGGCERARIDEVLELVGLTGRQRDRVAAYSHGMRQRLGLAQALLPRPELVILDEPATGLDPAGLIEIRNLLRHLAASEGMTIFLSSHLLAEVELICTDVGLVSNGRLVARGRVDELLAGTEQRASVTVDNPELALNVARALDCVNGAEALDGHLSLRLAPDSLGCVNRALVEAGVDVSALVPLRDSLEDLYMSVMQEAEHADTH